MFSSKLSNTLFAVFFNLGALFVTYLVMYLLAESNTNMELKAKNYQLHMQTLQYENLQERIEDTRRAKHDLRQNLAVIQSYLKNDDKEGLLKYLNHYIASLPADTPIVYCENYAVNVMIVYYADMAKVHDVSFDIDTRYPVKTAIADTDIVVLLGNLLENAVEACIRQASGEPFFSLHMRSVRGMLVITLDNSYSGTIHEKNQVFLSSKTNLPGTGTSSIKKITEKYHGILKLHYEESEFHASVMLCLQKI